MFIRILILSVCLIFSVSCVFPNAGGGSGGTVVLAPSTGDDTTSSTSTTRKTSSSRGTRRGSCEDDSGCEDTCEDIYNDSDDDENEGRVELCIEESRNTVEIFDDIVERLENPSSSILRVISDNYDDEFEKFLDISVEPWIELVKGLTANESEDTLIWIATSRNISSIIYERYEEADYEGFADYKGVKELLKEISSVPGALSDVTCAKYAQAICGESLARSGKTLSQLAENEAIAIAGDILLECQRDSSLNNLSDKKKCKYNDIVNQCGSGFSLNGVTCP